MVKPKTETTEPHDETKATTTKTKTKTMKSSTKTKSKEESFAKEAQERKSAAVVRPVAPVSVALSRSHGALLPPPTLLGPFAPLTLCIAHKPAPDRIPHTAR